MFPPPRKNAVSFLFGMLWQNATNNRNNIVLYWVMFILANAINLTLAPLAMSHVLDIIQREGVTNENFTTLLAFLAVLTPIEIIFWSLHGPARVIERMNAFGVKTAYKKHLMDGVMSLGMDWHTEHHSGDTIDKIEKGTTALNEFSENSFEVIASTVKFIICFIMLSYFFPSAGIIVCLMIVLNTRMILRVDKVLVKNYVDLATAENQVAESVFDAVSNIATVITLRVERLVLKAIEEKIAKPRALYKQTNILNEMKWFAMSLCNRLTTFFVLASFLYTNIGVPNTTLIAHLYLLMRYLEEISKLVDFFTYRYGDMVRRQTRVMNSEVLAKDFKTANETDHVLPKNWKRIEVKDLNFSYHTKEGADLHLENLAFSIQHGERIALVGASGSGKTTLLKVIRNLFFPSSLNLSVDGKEVEEGFSGISCAIALIPQNPEIFASTILNNLTLGATYTPEKIQKYLDMACFTEVVGKLPKGLESTTKEKGVNLSGGQSQRLALARGLLASEDKSIVLLDEPTSSLDTANEIRVYQNMFREFDGKTIISSIHRLHLLPMFDRIFFFEDGQITNIGTLSDLLESSEGFQELWNRYQRYGEEKPKKPEIQHPV